MLLLAAVLCGARESEHYAAASAAAASAVSSSLCSQQQPLQSAAASAISSCLCSCSSLNLNRHRASCDGAPSKPAQLTSWLPATARCWSGRAAVLRPRRAPRAGADGEPPAGHGVPLGRGRAQRLGGAHQQRARRRAGRRAGRTDGRLVPTLRDTVRDGAALPPTPGRWPPPPVATRPRLSLSATRSHWRARGKHAVCDAFRHAIRQQSCGGGGGVGMMTPVAAPTPACASPRPSLACRGHTARLPCSCGYRRRHRLACSCSCTSFSSALLHRMHVIVHGYGKLWVEYVLVHLQAVHTASACSASTRMSTEIGARH
jgi:hypothetical protein